MKKFTLALTLLISALTLNAQNLDLLLPTEHGMLEHQPAWLAQQDQVQEFTLSEGFTWWSTYIDLSNQGLSMLENALGNDATLIKSLDAGFNQYMPETETWNGNLLSINNSTMYLILINAPVSYFQLEGSPLTPDAVEITVNNGWNWVGYPNANEVEVDEALAEYTPSDNDMIKSQDGFSMYSVQEGKWVGSLLSLEPGKGYLILSYSEEPIVFHYSNGSRSEAPQHNRNNTVWNVNPHAYAQNMTVTASVSLQDVGFINDNYELGVFFGDECRGTTQLTYMDETNSYMAFLTAYGNENDPLQFRLLDRNTGNVYRALGQCNINYNDNAVVGNLSNPYPIEFRDLLSTEETLAGMVNIYPNPISNQQDLHITLPDNHIGTNELVIQVVNLLGQVVREEQMNTNNCTVGGLSSGLYTVRVLSGNTAIYNNKLIVK